MSVKCNSDIFLCDVHFSRSVKLLVVTIAFKTIYETNTDIIRPFKGEVWFVMALHCSETREAVIRSSSSILYMTHLTDGEDDGQKKMIIFSPSLLDF
jgi:hypothetical protein